MLDKATTERILRSLAEISSRLETTSSELEDANDELGHAEDEAISASNSADEATGYATTARDEADEVMSHLSDLNDSAANAHQAADEATSYAYTAYEEASRAGSYVEDAKARIQECEQTCVTVGKTLTALMDLLNTRLLDNAAAVPAVAARVRRDFLIVCSSRVHVRTIHVYVHRCSGAMINDECLV